MPQTNLTRCSACGERKSEKPSQVTWAWTNGEALRTAYRQRLCIDCYVVRVLAYDREIDASERLTCGGCGIDVDDDPQVTYCTSYVPGTGKISYQFVFCEEHALVLHEMCKAGADLLQEREPMLRGQAPQQDHSALDAWARLGILPRDAEARQ